NSPSVPTYEGSWFIGRRNLTETLYKGLIDEIAIYNRALSAAEVLSIYQG
ncbi:MAG: LamG-like jellyroll fold domain-containing protein, partial [Candidatus Doudnabacteria bacterium]